MKRFFLIISLSISLLEATPAQVIIIRHGEKPADSASTSLTVQGQERSGALPYYFKGTPDLLRFGLPVAIFAAKPIPQHQSRREIETISPTATLLGLPINTMYSVEQNQEIVNAILSDQRFEGKTVLICWEHHRISDLVSLFGVRGKINQYPDERFDLTWVVTFEDPSLPEVKVHLQKLMFQDSSTPFRPRG